MLAKALSSAVVGLESALVEVEVDLSPGLPSFQIVGLPDTAVQEARERVRAAIKNSGGRFPSNRITVNLTPYPCPRSGIQRLAESCCATVGPGFVQRINAGNVSR
jgi:magnesium chelatase family protein